MFVRHLMSTTILASGPAWQNSDVGQYGSRTQYDVDRNAGVTYRTIAGQRGDATAYSTGGQVDSQGRVLQLIDLNTAARRVSRYAANAVGPVGPALESYPIPAIVASSTYQTQSYWQLYGTAANLQQQSQSGLNAVYRLTHIDLASGQSYPMGTVTTAEVQSLVGFNTGDELYVMSGRFFGFQQTTSSEWAPTLPAGSGRALRAFIPRQIYEEKGRAPLWQMRAAATPGLVDIAPWRRPKLSTTRVRAYSLTVPSVSYLSGGVTLTVYATPFPRRGVAVEPISIATTEVELSDSLGTEMLNGQPVSRHTMTVHSSLLTGFLKVSTGGGLEFVTTSRGDSDDTLTVQQYLNADGTPTSEFVNAAAGRWFYAPGTITSTGSRPLMATVNNLLTTPIGGDATSFNVLDMAGQFVRTGKLPPSTANGGMLYLPNADMLWTPTNLYASNYASFDLGTTWVPMKHWGPRGSVDPGGRPAGIPAENQDLRTVPALFYT